MVFIHLHSYFLIHEFCSVNKNWISLKGFYLLFWSITLREQSLCFPWSRIIRINKLLCLSHPRAWEHWKRTLTWDSTDHSLSLLFTLRKSTEKPSCTCYLSSKSFNKSSRTKSASVGDPAVEAFSYDLQIISIEAAILLEKIVKFPPSHPVLKHKIKSKSYYFNSIIILLRSFFSQIWKHRNELLIVEGCLFLVNNLCYCRRTGYKNLSTHRLTITGVNSII